MGADEEADRAPVPERRTAVHTPEPRIPEEPLSRASSPAEPPPFPCRQATAPPSHRHPHRHRRGQGRSTEQPHR